jgi:cation diffusion facilitator family transporter
MGEANHDHEHAGEHHHEHGHGGWRGALRSLFSPHRHDPADSIDQALEASGAGIQAVKVSLVVLVTTALIQAVIVGLSGSVALLGETLHNVSDGTTALPLWLAFSLGRRPPTRRFTYGYGRAEDLAGIFIVVIVAGSVGVTIWQAIERLVHPTRVHHLPFVMAAAVIGLIGNEVVARYRLRVGNRIGSATLVADGNHARADGLTSLAVLIGAVAIEIGAPQADSIAALVVSAFIMLVLVRALRSVGERLMDAIDPAMVAQVERVAAGVPGVIGCGIVRLRWIGHRLHAELNLEVDGTLSVVDAHEVAEAVHHTLLHEVSNLSDAMVHLDPAGASGADPHQMTAHHRPAQA